MCLLCRLLLFCQNRYLTGWKNPSLRQEYEPLYQNIYNSEALTVEHIQVPPRTFEYTEKVVLLLQFELNLNLTFN